MEKPKHIILFSNGNVACFDEKDEQIPELQKDGWLIAWLKEMERKGITDLTDCKIETIVNGREAEIKPFKTIDGDFNYQII
jgi:hypothetical protein